MTRLNVDRMRRYAEAGRIAADEAEKVRAREEWLNAMTPEHRARHERSTPAFCEVCLRGASERAGRRLAALGEAFKVSPC